jgi:hypothetical protein
MLHWLPLLIIVGLVLYLVSWFRSRYLYGPVRSQKVSKPRIPESLKEMWIQLYETNSQDEAQKIKAYLEELEVKNIQYEQGKKGIDGNPLPGIGLAVPKSHLRRAQNLLFRFLERNK